MQTVYFPDYDDTLPLIDGFADSSYGNDSCPSIHNADLNLTIMCDYKDASKRECDGLSRYSVSDADGMPVFESDDLSEVIAFVVDYDGAEEKCRNGLPLSDCHCC